MREEILRIVGLWCPRLARSWRYRAFLWWLERREPERFAELHARTVALLPPPRTWQLRHIEAKRAWKRRNSGRRREPAERVRERCRRWYAKNRDAARAAMADRYSRLKEARKRDKAEP